MIEIISYIILVFGYFIASQGQVDPHGTIFMFIWRDKLF